MTVFIHSPNVSIPVCRLHQLGLTDDFLGVRSPFSFHAATCFRRQAVWLRGERPRTHHGTTATVELNVSMGMSTGSS